MKMEDRIEETSIIKGRLIDGNGGEAIENGLVAIKGRRILYAGAADGYALTGGERIYEVQDGTVMPGMIDCHAHLSGEESQNLQGRSPYDCLLAAAHDIGVLVDAGITGVRDMSRFGAALERAVKAGILRGPKIMPGGRVISVTAGHADTDTEKSVEEVNAASLIGYLADGKEGCLRAVRNQFRDGARFIKICATGGVSSSVDNPNDIQYSEEELQVMIEEAARRSSYVAAHCTGLAGTKQAIKAGVHSVEHGVNLDEECVQLMKEKDITLVSTCHIPLGFSRMTDLPADMVERGMACGRAIRSSYKLARQAGVRLAMGTDFSNSVNTPYQYIGKELKAICECGYTPMEAVTAATKNGAYLMETLEETGTLEAGKLADVLLVQGNPLEDIAVLGNAENIRCVWIDGKKVK